MSENVKLVILGTGGVGKSAITVQYVQNIFVEKYDPTIEDQYRKHCQIDETFCNLEILDTAGTDQFIAMRDIYMKSGDAFMFVYSITSYASFNDLDDMYNQVVVVKDVDSKDTDFKSKCPMYLVGNKCDLEDDRIVETEAGQEKAINWNCDFVEVSAYTRENVNQPFEELVRSVLAHRASKKKKRRRRCVIV